MGALPTRRLRISLGRTEGHSDEWSRAYARVVDVDKGQSIGYVDKFDGKEIEIVLVGEGSTSSDE